MNRLFLDTNIMLDLLGERVGFYEPAAKIATLAEKGDLTIVVSPLSFVTVNYLLSKFENPEIARKKLRKFKIISSVSAINERTVEKSLNSSIKDFEDALQYFCALEANCNVIITHDGKYFKQSLLPVMTAFEYLKSNNK